ncbi:MAG: NAD-dependent epimerase/dehydratase family protein [Caedimonas sp.]|nr:NAD-dependent epimerase/dehydratase family protein [Caedimonas sp.]
MVKDDRMILVTGATGFVGRHLCETLEREGYKVKKLSLSIQKDNFELFDKESKKNFLDLVKEAACVIHLAACVHVEKYPLEHYLLVNTKLTSWLAEESLKVGVRKFIFMSSILAERPTLKDTAETVDAPDYYGFSKLRAEQILMSLNKKEKTKFIILRTPIIYGPYVKANFLALLNLINKSLPLPLSLIKNRRSLLYIGNLVNAILTIIQKDVIKKEIFRIADREYPSTPSLIRMLSKQMGKKVFLYPAPLYLLKWCAILFHKKNAFKSLTENLEINNSDMREEFNWVPPYSMEEGLKKTAEWYKSDSHS